MERTALHAALRAAGVPGGYYRIEGVHEPVPPPVDFLYVRRAPDDPEAWETGAYERGRWEPVARHRDESAACAHLLRLLTGTARGPRPGSGSEPRPGSGPEPRPGSGPEPGP